MDNGRVCQECYAEVSCHDAEVWTVGINTVCYICVGWGHTARECPTQATGKRKGDGERSGEKGKGWGKGPAALKGWSKEKGKEKGADSKDKGQGKGKGYQGACWQCGKIGHISHGV